MRNNVKPVLLLMIFSKMISAGVMSPFISPHCMDFDSQYAYIGTPSGLSIYDKEKDRWLNWEHAISEKATVKGKEFSYITAPNILSVLSDSEWAWASVYEDGVYRVNLKTNHIEHWRNDEYYSYDEKDAVICPFPSNHIISINKDKKGNYWFASTHGISQYDGKNWEVIYVTTYYIKGILDASVTSLAIDNKSRLWIGTSDFWWEYYELDEKAPNEEDVKGGLVLHDDEKTVYYYAYNYNLEKEDTIHFKTPLLSNDVHCVVIDNHDIWISSKGGISVYNYDADTWQNFDSSSCSVLTEVISIAVTPDYVWTASIKGIAKFDKQEATWSIMGEKELPHKSVRSIAYDPFEKSIWAVTDLYAYTDIYAYRYKNNEWIIYPTRQRVEMRNPDDLVQLGIFLDRRKVYSEAKVVFKEFLTKYPTHEKSKYAKKELLLLEQSGW